MLYSLVAIALGATLGSWARWGLSLWLNPANGPFSFGTLAANLIGGYAIGLAMGWFAAHPHWSPEWRLFVFTGLLGGLTTFSTFSAETVQLLLKQQYGWALTTVAAHLAGSVLLTVLGLISVRVLRGAA